MVKVRTGSVFLIVAVFILSTCIDPYTPKLNGYQSLLVVDGLITDANTSYTVKLSSTFQDLNAGSSPVQDASVFITDDNGTASFLNNLGNGIYKTDSLVFQGILGKTYVLHIHTYQGEEYESDPCLMHPVPEIDSVYFAKDQQFVSNGTEMQEGLSIYLDAAAGDNNSYYRWDFEETWKFSIPIPKRYDYINKSTFKPVEKVKEYCWKSMKSADLIVRSVNSGQSSRIVKEPITFIGTGESDRLMMEYSILIRQYSISYNDYNFWDNLKKVNETGSDIFASQPYSVISNIHNITDPKEKVLGYFQVSAVKEKRIFISFNDIVKMHLPFYHANQCQRIEDGPEIGGIPFDELYRIYCVTSDYEFIEPEYNPETGGLEFLVFARPECANCELTGTMTKPDFWIDQN
jgi:hypothetical protein